MSFTTEECRAYCRHESVRARVREFFGNDARGEPLALFLAVGTEAGSRYREALPVEELSSWLDRGAEVNRSLWDRESLLCHLDIEYVNFDHPSLAFADAPRAFALQAPALVAADAVLASFGIHPLKLVTGRGFHLVWRIGKSSRAFQQLAASGHVSASLKRLYAVQRAPTGEHVAPESGAAFAALGCLMEFIAQQVKSQAAPVSELPVELGAIEVGAGPEGREVISVDITEYADPLSARVTRTPFSVYLKPAQSRDAIGEEVLGHLLPIMVIPLDRLTISDALHLRGDPLAVAEFAETASVEIPDASPGMERLIAAYQASSLAAFHADFYSQEHDAPGLWPETYDSTPLEILPPCARFILEHPNDLLLRPGCVQRVVRVLLSLGWHPRHIGGLLRSKYERDHGWGDQWSGYDPATRADFYARVFAGLFATGVDDLVDFNCQSAREAGICFTEHCSENLLRFRGSLLDRRKYERMARRPIHRLFLPEEHL